MSAVIPWLIFVAGYVFTYRKVYPVAFETLNDAKYPDPMDRGFAAVMALMTCVLWPLVLIGYVAYRFLTPQAPAEREAALRERERHIADMERELGIGDPR